MLEAEDGGLCRFTIYIEPTHKETVLLSIKPLPGYPPFSTPMPGDFTYGIADPETMLLVRGTGEVLRIRMITLYAAVGIAESLLQRHGAELSGLDERDLLWDAAERLLDEFMKDFPEDYL